MPKSVNERVAEWRVKNALKGARALTVWLDPKTAKMLDELSQQFKYPTYLKRGTKTSLITHAIKHYYMSTFSVTVTE